MYLQQLSSGIKKEMTGTAEVIVLLNYKFYFLILCIILQKVHLIEFQDDTYLLLY